MPKGNCPKCGAVVYRPTPEFSVVIDGDDDMRLAKVQFRRSVYIELNGNMKEFAAAEVIILNFALIHALKEQDATCLYFLIPKQKALYDAAY